MSGRRVLLTTDAVGGVWRYTATLATEWAALGVTPVVAVLGPAPSDAAAASLARATGHAPVVTALPLDWTAPDPHTLARAADALAALAGAERVASVHLHAPALHGATRWPAPVVAVVHSCLRTWWAAMRGGTALPPDLAWRDAAAASGLDRATAVVAPSGPFARAVEAAYGLAPGCVRAVPNGLPARSPADAPASLPRDPGVLACGRLWDEAKDIATLERASASLPDTIPVEAAGPLEGPNGERAPALRRVRALGSLDDATLARVRARRSVFVATARYEPFGLAVLEAAADGMALVLADIPTARALWHGAARFFPPGDADALARAIAAALADPEPLAAAARARAARHGAAPFARDTLAVHDDALLRAAA